MVSFFLAIVLVSEFEHVRGSPYRNLAAKLLPWRWLVICQRAFDWDRLLSCAPLITVVITHVGHQASHVVMFLLDFVGLDGLEAWWVHRACYAMHARL